MKKLTRWLSKADEDLKMPTWLAKARTGVQRVGLPPSRIPLSVGLWRSHEFGVK